MSTIKYEHLKWIQASASGTLTPNVMVKYANCLSWDLVCICHSNIPEYVLRKAEQFICNWDPICKYQNLSEQFIRDYAHKLDMEILINRGLVSDELYVELQMKGVI